MVEKRKEEDADEKKKTDSPGYHNRLLIALDILSSLPYVNLVGGWIREL